MSNDPHALVGAYATDSTTPQERAEFQVHLERCSECRAELASYQEVLADLASAHPVRPPTWLEDEVVSAATIPVSAGTAGASAPDTAGASAPDTAGASAPDTAPVAHRALRWMAIAASAALLFLTGALLGRTTAPVAPVAEPPTTAVDSILAVAAAGDATLLPAAVMGTESHVVASDEMGKAVLLAEDLPTPAKGMCYQVWAVAPDGTKSSAGVFLPDARGHVAAVLTIDPDAEAYVITIEPPGGSTEPTGKMVGQVTT